MTRLIPLILIVLLASVVPAPRAAQNVSGTSLPASGQLGASANSAVTNGRTVGDGLVPGPLAGAPQALAAAGRSGTWAYANRSHGPLRSRPAVVEPWQQQYRELVAAREAELQERTRLPGDAA